jgi:hypothetical protein
MLIPATFVTRSLRYESEVKAGILAAVGEGGSTTKESKPASTLGAPRQPADDLPSMGELFSTMDVPVFLTNDDVTP